MDAHHIRHWARGGETKLANLMLLCGHHHRLVHEGGYSIDCRTDGRTVFRRPDGLAIPAVPRNRAEARREPAAALSQSGPPPRHEAGVALSAGDPLDHGVAVEALLNRNGLLDLPPPDLGEPAGHGPGSAEPVPPPSA